MKKWAIIYYKTIKKYKKIEKKLKKWLTVVKECDRILLY